MPYLEQMFNEAAYRPIRVADVDDRPITRDDVKFIHTILDELGAPRLCDQGTKLPIRWRLIALNAAAKR